MFTTPVLQKFEESVKSGLNLTITLETDSLLTPTQPPSLRSWQTPSTLVNNKLLFVMVAIAPAHVIRRERGRVGPHEHVQVIAWAPGHACVVPAMWTLLAHCLSLKRSGFCLRVVFILSSTKYLPLPSATSLCLSTRDAGASRAGWTTEGVIAR